MGSRPSRCRTNRLPAEDPPAGQVVAGVHQGVVPARHLGQGRATPVVPELTQVLGEPGDLPGQRGHRAPELSERDVVVGAVPGPQLQLLPRRSEEHTSELQSRVDLVCRLLLEKKKAPNFNTPTWTIKDASCPDIV